MLSINDYLQAVAACGVQNDPIKLNERCPLFSCSRIAMLLLDLPAMNIIEINEAASRLYGYTTDDLCGKSLSVLLDSNPEDDFPDWRMLMEHPPFNFHGKYRRSDGRIEPVELSGNPVDIGGRRFLLLMVFEDVADLTEIHDYILALKRHEALFQEQSTALMLIETRKSLEIIRFLDINQTAERLFGLSRLAFRTMEDPLLRRLDEIARRESAFRDLRRRGFTHFTHILQLTNGRSIPLEIHLKLFCQKDRHLVLCLAREVVLQDMLSLHQAPMSNLLANLFSHSHDAILILDRYRKIISLNEPAMRLFGWSDNVVGSAIFNELGDYSCDEIAQNIQMTELYGYLSERVIQEVRKGHLQYLHLLSSRIDLVNGDYFLVMMYIDETHRSETLSTNALFSGILMNEQDGVMIFDSQMRIIWFNRGYARMTGHKLADLVDRPAVIDQLFFDRRNENGSLAAALEKQGSWKGEVFAADQSGQHGVYFLNMFAAEEERLQSRYYIGIVGELSHWERSDAEFDSLLYIDNLTRLHNRLFNEQRMLQMIKQNKPFTMLFLDVDRFKHANDLYGYEAGDHLLTEISRLLLEHFHNQVVSRLSGDDFSILCEEPMAEVLLSLEQLFVTFNRWSEQNNYFFLTLSVGIARYPEDARTVRDILRCASQAIHLAKQQAGNSFAHYAPEIGAAYLSSIQEEEALGHAVKHGEIFLAYQPIVRICDQKIVGFEALMRWNSKRFGLVSPARFIPMAERTGVILELGRKLVQQCQQDLPLFQSTYGDAVFLTMNISLVQLMDARAVDDIISSLGRAGAMTGQYILEITETQYVENFNHLRDVIKRFRKYGIRVAIDDFGTGYSSLNKLLDLDIDMIKVDQSFTRDIDTKPRSQALLKVITSMAEVFRFDLLIEGVENDQQLGYIDRSRVKYVQGYLFGRPQRINEWIRE